MASILRVRDKDGNIIDIPFVKGDNYVLTKEDKQEIADAVLANFVDVSEVGA